METLELQEWGQKADWVEGFGQVSAGNNHIVIYYYIWIMVFRDDF